MRWIVRIVGVLALLVVVATVSLFFLPAERIAKVAVDQIRAATGREVSITGDVAMTLWPVLGVSAGGLEVGNAEWAENGAMLSASDAAIGVDAAALLRGEIRITNIEATRPTIRLQSLADGRANWQFTDADGGATLETTTDADRAPGAFSIKRLSVTDATLVYDAQGSDRVSYSGVDLDLDWPERLGDATINAVLRPTTQSVSVKAEIEQFASFLAGNVQNVNFALSGADGTADLTGRASLAGEVAGRLNLAIPDTGAFLRALGLPGPELPRDLGRSVEGSADLTLTRDRALALRKMSLSLGANTLTGAADISLNGKPQVNAKIDAGTLDLTNASSGGNSGETSGSNGWPTDQIDASALAGFDGAVALSASSINFGTLNLGATRALVRNENSRMVFELREAAAYDGAVSGEFVVNNRNGLSVGGKLFGRSIALNPLLSDLAGLSRLSATADVEINFLGVGGSVDAIMHSLSGSGALKTGSGTIDGINLDRLMKSGEGKGGTTVFDSLGATFAMKDGVASNDDLLILLPNFEARGAGDINLGEQTLDYLFTPKSLRGNGTTGISIPVRISGPWVDPRIRPDLEAAIDLNFAEEKKELENKAKKEVRRAVEKELGVTVEDGQSVEDAVEDKVKTEIERGLRRLFD